MKCTLAFLADWAEISNRTCYDTSLSCKVQFLTQNSLNVSYSACHMYKWFPLSITCGPFSKIILWGLQTPGRRAVGDGTPKSWLWTGAPCLLTRAGTHVEDHPWKHIWMWLLLGCGLLEINGTYHFLYCFGIPTLGTHASIWSQWVMPFEKKFQCSRLFFIKWSDLFTGLWKILVFML